MIKIFLKYAIVIFSVIIIFNIFIGNFVYNQSNEAANSIGSAKEPNTRFLSAAEGFFDEITDEFGFNNDHIQLEKNGKIRILSLGDSMTEAVNLPRHMNYSCLLEQRLNKGGLGLYEVFNLGRQARAVPDYIYFADGYKSFQPDFTVISIHPSDFMGGNLVRIVKEEGEYKLLNDTLNNDLFQKFKYIKEKSGWFSPIVGYSGMRLKKYVAKYDLHLPNILKSKVAKGDQSLVSGDDDIFGDPGNVIDWQINQLANIYGDNLVFLYIAEIPTIQGGNLLKEESEENLVLKEVIIRAAKKRGVDLIDTTQAFVEYYENYLELPVGFNNMKPGIGHLNEIGHSITAGLLSEYLFRQDFR